MHDQSQQNLPSLKSDNTREEIHQRAQRTKGAWWIAAVVLAVVAVVGAARYGHPIVREHGILLAQLAGMQDSLAAFGKRMDVAEEKLRAWATDWDDLGQRMSKLENKVNYSLQVARKQSRKLAVQLQQRMQMELDRRMQGIQARLGRLESDQESERTRVAKLQQEIAVVRQETAEQIAHLQQDMGRDFGNVDLRLASLNQQVDRGKRDLDAFGRQLDRQRVDFELGKNHSRELIPGISIDITSTDIGCRRFGGRLWLLRDRRAVWVRDQGVQQPVVFYCKQDARPHELVVTHVTTGAVAGYLQAPSRPSASPGLNDHLKTGQRSAPRTQVVLPCHRAFRQAA
jgi:predicted  nucleic acid-binding Zn-ribbon protein